MGCVVVVTSIEKAHRKSKVGDNVCNTKSWFVFVLMALLDLFVFWVHQSLGVAGN